MKKILILLLVVVMTASALSSCGLFHKHTYASEWSMNDTHHWREATCKHTDKQGDLGEHVDSDNNSFCDVCNHKTGEGIWTQNSSPADGELIWSPDMALKIVAEAEDNATGKLVYHFYSNWGRKPELVAPDKQAGAGKIILGNLGYAITDKANELLSKYADNYILEENGESAFLIYADGGSLAVTYTDIYSYNAAVDYIIDNLHDREFYASGVVEAKIFNIKEFIASERDKEREKVFVKIEETLGKEATDELRRIYTLYNEDLYIWLANTYEPEMIYEGKYYGGAFYYSNSARDYEGYLPDLESTGQALAIIDNSGLGAALGAEKRWGADKKYWGGIGVVGEENRSVSDRNIYSHEFLPAEMWEQMYTFVETLYNSQDGYFYHPQWLTVGTNRKGRDSGWAKGIIQMYMKSAAYDPSEEMPRFYIPKATAAVAGRLGATSVATAVSMVVPTATAAELQSQAAWYAYLDKGFSNGSYSICHNLNSRTSEIKNAGLWDATLTYLETHQKANGLWEDEVTYDSLSGLMKVSSFWNSSRPFPNAKAALDSAIELISREDDEALDAIVYVYNPWVAMDNIFGACSVEDQRSLMQYLLDNTADLFQKTYLKLAKFKKADGGFSYKPDSSAHLSQEVLVAVEGTAESDMNATSIAISSILNNMLAVYELDSIVPELYYKYDALYFLEELDGLDAVIKHKLVVEDPYNSTFEDYDPLTGEEANGIVKYPSISSQMNIGSTEIGDDGNYKYIFSEIITSPVDAQNHGNVLHVKDMVYDANGNDRIDDDGIECPDIKKGGSNTEFKILNHALVGNTYVLDMDMYCLGAEDFYYTKEDGTTAFNASPLMQIMFSQHGTSNHSVWLNLVPYAGEDGKVYIRINENFAGTDGVKSENIVRGIPLNEWVNLRIETYKMYDENSQLIVKAKIFVNDVFMAETDSSHMTNGVYSNFPINSVKLAYYRTLDSEFYLDNVFLYKANTVFESEQLDDSKVDTTVSAPSKYDFETNVTEGIYSTLYAAQKDDGNRASQDQTKVEIDVNRPSNMTHGVFFSIVDDPAGGAGKVLKINSKNTSSAAPGVIELDAKKEAGKRVHIINYDFYFGSNANTADMIQLELLDAAGVKTGGAVTITKNTAKNEFKLKNATAAEKLVAGKWYKIRISIDSEAKQIHYHFSDDGGKTYYVGAQPSDLSFSATISKIRMIINAYNFGGDVYMDNMSYTVAAKVPEAEIIVNEMAGVNQPTEKTTYDFNDGLIPVTDYFKATSIFGGKTYTAGTSEYNSAIAANGKSGDANLLKVAGMQFYVVNDPKDATNKVLQVVSNKASGSNSTIDVIASKVGSSNTVLELTFDYYMDYNLFTQTNLPIMRVMFWDGQYVPEDVAAERRLSVFAQTTSSNKFTFDAGKPEGQETTMMSGGVKFGDYVADSHTWYTFKIIISGGKQYTYMANKSGTSYTLLATADFKADTTTMKYARLYFNSYQSTSRQYVDNISYEMKDTFVDPTK